MARMLQQRLLNAVVRCLKSGEFTDLTITCGDDVHKVHKMIVCTQSDVLAAAIRFGGKEAEQSKIDLPDDDPRVVKLLIRYLYTGDYRCSPPSPALPSDTATIFTYDHKFPHTCGRDCRETLCDHDSCRSVRRCRENIVCRDCAPKYDNASASDILTHAKMYEIADKYNIPDLKELSRKKFSFGCALYWDDDTFPKAAHYALSTTMEEDKGLRSVVSDTVAAHMSLVTKPEIEVLVKDFSGFSYDILLKKATRYRSS